MSRARERISQLTQNYRLLGDKTTHTQEMIITSIPSPTLITLRQSLRKLTLRLED